MREGQRDNVQRSKFAPDEPIALIDEERRFGVPSIINSMDSIKEEPFVV